MNSASALFSEHSVDTLLDAFARLAIGIGVNVQPQQELILAAPLESAPLVRHLASTAYARGASLVTALFDDPELLRTRLLESEPVGLDKASAWLANGVAQKLREGAAYLSVLGPRPELLAGVDIGRIVRAHTAQARAYAMQTSVIANMETNASAVPFVTSTWARRVFPDCAPQAATRLLWSALIESVGGADLMTTEQTATRRQNTLSDRRSRLQISAFRAIQCSGPHIRLTIGLADGHIWRGGQDESFRGVKFTPVLPAEALFTATAADKAEGTIAFSRPITIAGECVDGLEVHFEAGAVTGITAKSGQAAFEQLLNSDPGAKRLGKVALVETIAPLARHARSFHNPMLDGASAPHIAFGAASPGTVSNSSAANQSAIHIEAMFDAGGLSADGIDDDGIAHAILRDGVFVL